MTGKRERIGSVLRERTFRSLRERNCRLFFAGHAVSVIGTWMQRVAQDWLVYTFSHSAVALGIASASPRSPSRWPCCRWCAGWTRSNRSRPKVWSDSLPLTLVSSP
jgi:hypothetical protein